MSQTLNTVPAASGTTATLREFGTYEEAQQLVDRLSDARFPVEQVRIVSSVIFGALWGAVFGFAAHWATKGRRDFSSVRGLEAERYAVQVEACFEDDAARVGGIA